MGEAKQDVLVTAGERADATLVLKLATAETITVTSEAPMVDKFNVGVGATMESKVGVEVTGENRTFYGVINFMPGVTNEDENADLSSTRPNINGATWADSNVIDRRRRHHVLALRRHPRLHPVDRDHRGEPRVGRQGRRLRPHHRLGDQRHRQVRHQQLPRRGHLQPHRGVVELGVRGAPRARAARVEPGAGGLLRAHRARRRTRTTSSTRRRWAVRSSATRPGSSSRSTSRTPTTSARPSTATSSTRAATSSRASRRSTGSPPRRTRWRSASSTPRCCATSCWSRCSTATA